jgi:hypothetical protein
MRLNIYSGDLTGDLQVVEKSVEGRTVSGIRLFTKDGGAITLWGDVRADLKKAAAALDLYHGEPQGLYVLVHALQSLPPGAMGMVSSPVPPYKQDLIPVALDGLRNTIARAVNAQTKKQEIEE